jgi:voltage-gated potassium channel
VPKLNLSRRTVYGLLAIGVYLFLLFGLMAAEREVPGAKIDSLPDALWYSIVTLTTVGYGDAYPVTPVGRAIGYTFVLGSLGVLGLLISRITEAFVNMRETRKMGLLGTDFTGHIVVIGWDTFAQSVVDELLGADRKVAIVTNNREHVDPINERYGEKDVFVLVTDYSNYTVLEKANISRAATVFLNLEDDTQKLVYSLNLKKQYDETEQVVILNNTDLEDTFHSAGVTFTLSRDGIAAKIVASYIFEPDVARYAVELLSSAVSADDHDIQQFLVTENNPHVNRDYAEVFRVLKEENNIILIGISKLEQDGSHRLLKNPAGAITVAAGDYLIMIMSGENEAPITELFGVREGFIPDP